MQRDGVQVWDINEYRTSKMCHKAKLKKKPADEEAVPCYQVLYCTECQVFMQRDVDASLNIWLLTRYKLEG